MLTFERLVRNAAYAVAAAGLLILLVLAFFTLLDGLLRAFANRPLDFVREIGDLVAAVAGACCLPIVVLERGNIVLRAFDGRLPVRAVQVIDLVNAAAMLIVLTAMAWQFWLFSLKTMRGGEITWLLNVPKAPFWFVIDGIIWLTAAVQLLLLLQATSQLRRTA